ncbi:MAG: DUF3078 domain-containing protein [Crocinitomicaceae bacterium]|nr:DUF3078 domain-containing protein [Crocinitomicaceae bacterium]
MKGKGIKTTIAVAMLTLHHLCTITLAQTVTPTLTAAEESALRNSAAPPQDTVLWLSKGLINIHFSQVQLNNWAAGGQSNLSLLTKFDQNWNLDRERFGWDSELHLAFGLLHRPEDRVFLKTDDRIEWSTKFGYRTTTTGFITIMAHFRSQLAPGYAIENGVPNRDLLNSNWLSPGYGVVAAGMDYKHPSNAINVFLAPITFKSTWVLDDSLSQAGAFGVTPGETSRYEVGGYLKMNANWKISEEISYSLRLDLFSNFMDNPQNIDVYSDHLISLKINTWLTTTISATLIYDDDISLTKNPQESDGALVPNIGPGLQLKQVLSVGLSLTI